jgi:hypothetical protein
MTTPTLQQSQAADNRPGMPGQGNSFPRPSSPPDRGGATGKQPKRKSPWTEHLVSLIGEQVIAYAIGPASLIEFKGKLIAIALDHMNCAIETDGHVFTIKGIHHIRSVSKRGAA